MAGSFKSQAYDFIRQKLMFSSLNAGEKLSSVAIAREMGISRMPVREAINQLEREGLIRQVPKVGIFVTELDRAEFLDLFRLRSVLEGFAAGEAAVRITREQIALLRQSLHQMRRISRQVWDENLVSLEGDLARQMLVADAAFHMVILQASGSKRTLKIVQEFNLLTSTFKRNRFRSPVTADLKTIMWYVLRSHGRIFACMRRGDAAGAKYWMEDHVSGAMKSMLDEFDELERSRSISSSEWSSELNSVIAQLEGQGNAQSARRPVTPRRRGRPRKADKL